MVFVEGKCEEICIPKIYQWYTGIDATNLGIDFVNIEGVDKLKTTVEKANELKKHIYKIQEEVGKVISNNKLKKLNEYVKY